MREHAKKGNIVFFSSHLIDIVESLCTKIAIIKKGKILTCKTIKEVEELGIPLEQFYLDTTETRVVAAKVGSEEKKETFAEVRAKEKAERDAKKQEKIARKKEKKEAKLKAKQEKVNTKHSDQTEEKEEK